MVFSLDGFPNFLPSKKGIPSLLQVRFFFKNIRQILEGKFFPGNFTTF
jgi:hypothetical protein